MVETAKRLNKQMDDVIDIMLKEAFDSNSLKYMKPEQLDSIHKCLELSETCKDYLIKEAETMERIDKKLDILLVKKEVK